MRNIPDSGLDLISNWVGNVWLVIKYGPIGAEGLIIFVFLVLVFGGVIFWVHTCKVLTKIIRPPAKFGPDLTTSPNSIPFNSFDILASLYISETSTKSSSVKSYVRPTLRKVKVCNTYRSYFIAEKFYLRPGLSEINGQIDWFSVLYIITVIFIFPRINFIITV